MALTKRELKLAIKKAKKYPAGVAPAAWDCGEYKFEFEVRLEKAGLDYIKKYG